MADHSVSLFFSVKSWMCIYLYMFLVLWSSCFNTVTGQHQVIGSSQPILAKVGDEVTLPCHIEPPVDMAKGETVEWNRPDLHAGYVYLLQDGNYNTEIVNPLYKERTTLFHEKLSDGNISLKLSRVRLSDEGTYKCFVPVLRISSLIQLLVGSVSQPVISSNGPTDNGVSLSCDSGCWYPQPEMSWLDRDGNNIPAGTSLTDRPSQHCYDVQRNVTVRIAGQVTCRVHLPHFNHTVETHCFISESDITTDGGSTGRGRHGMVVTVIMVAAALGALYWDIQKTTRRNKLIGLLVKTSGHRHITYYEDQLQHNMNKTCLGVTLGTMPEIMFENIYIPLYNVDINVTDIHRHHEVRQMERKKAGKEKEIQLSEIFKDPSGRNKRTVLTVGCAGIGKTFFVHKFVFDWAKKSFPQDPHLIFSFKFRQLNLLKGQKLSLAKLIHKCIKETRFIEEDVLNYIFNILQKSGDYDDSPVKVLFVMDGYDEKKILLDFTTNFGLMNVTDSHPVENLLVNLIKGELLPSAHIWITSRPVAANRIPKEFVNRMTEVRGFIRDEQKKEFFMKTFRDENQANSIYSQIKESSSLHTMCEIPVFCWILATVVQNMGMGFKLPKTLVEMYCYFLMGETQRENPALHEADKKKLIEAAGEVLLKLGRLAFDQLDKGNIIFYKEDLKACGLDVNKDLQNSGFCTKFFKEDDVFFLQTVYCFVHLSIQEFLAAVYLFHCFTQKNMKVLKTFLGVDVSSLDDFLQRSFEKHLNSKNGQLDLFVRFLHGLSLESNQSLLGGLMGKTENSTDEIQRAIHNLKEMKCEYEDISPDRCINIFHCLMEMNDHSLHQEIQQYLKSGDRSKIELSESQCSALAFMLLMSEEVLDELDMDEYNTSSWWGNSRLIPAVRNCRKARLVGCQLEQPHFEIVASALSSNPSHLRELDLSYNDMQDAFIVRLSAGLKSPHCELEILRLAGCNITKTGFEVLASALSSNISHLRELDLSFISLLDSQLEQLSAELKSPHCRLQILRLSGCGVTEEGCSSLASALTFNPSHLKQLYLNFSYIGDAGLKKLSAALETLHVNHGGEHWIKPQLLTRYFQSLTLDTNTACDALSLSENNMKATRVDQVQPYPDHLDRFDEQVQVLCSEGLTGRCYWEVEWSGEVWIAVTYRGINRKGRGEDCGLGFNDKSWSLFCSDSHHDNSCSVTHNSRSTALPVGPSDSNRVAVDEDSEDRVNRVAVYLDWSAGTLSFYKVLEDTLTHLYTLQNTFTEPLYAGFMIHSNSSSVSLCENRQGNVS